MNDIQEPTAAQKKENIIKALTIAGFTENPEYPGMYAQINGNIKTVVDLTAGASTYLYDIAKKKKIVGAGGDGALKEVTMLIIDAEDGKMPTKSKPDEVVNVPKKSDVPPPESNEPEVFDPPEPAQNTTKEVAEQARDFVKDVGDKIKHSAPKPETVELTIDIVKKYINEKVTDEEAYRFIQLCKARHLNPFIGQVHLIKKEFTGTAKTVVGKDVFMETATRHPQYDGFEAGIIIKAKGKKTTEDRPGAFLDDDETLVGGWAKVHRKDQKYCTEARVSMKEYNTSKASWKRIPATMIRKVPLVQAQREAFAAELSGMYDSSEMGVDIE